MSLLILKSFLKLCDFTSTSFYTFFKDSIHNHLEFIRKCGAWTQNKSVTTQKKSAKSQKRWLDERWNHGLHLCVCAFSGRSWGALWHWGIKLISVPVVCDWIPWCTAAEGTGCWGESPSLRGGSVQSHGWPAQTKVSDCSAFSHVFINAGYDKTLLLLYSLLTVHS